MKTRWFKPFLVALVVSAIGMTAGVLWWRYPWLITSVYTWKVATGPVATDGQKFFAAFVREVKEEYPRIQFQPFVTANLAENAKALIDGSADLAIVRSDDPLAGKASTLLILRKMLVVFLADPQSNLESANELKSKRIGIAANPNDPLVKSILEFYGFPARDLVPVAPADIGKAIKDKRVAAVMVVGPLGPGPVADAIGAIKKATKRTPTLLAIDEAEAINKRFPVYDKVDIPKRAFDGTPEDEVETVALTIRLMARPSLSNYSAGSITRLVLRTKAQLVATLPAVTQIEAPDTDGVTVLPVHPGAAAYLKGEQQSLYEIVSDNLFTVMLIGGLLGPLAGGMVSRVRKRGAQQIETQFSRLASLHETAHAIPADQRDAVDRELDQISAKLFAQMNDHTIEPDRFLAATIVIDRIRAALRRAPGPAHAPS